VPTVRTPTRPMQASSLATGKPLYPEVPSLA
jgi:hypothetical protein